ncbi:MAG TPA: acyltransferase family protein, partial [Candidatus Elarobacter sp.]|nr:acyltransferase family protein [Candidatus Elarobacter sp.]
LAVAIGLAPHFLLHGFLDGTEPWLLGLFGMGVVAAQLSTRGLNVTPWRWLSVAGAVAAVAAMVTNGEGTRDGAYWGADLIVGAAVAVFFVASSGLRAPLLARVLSLRPIVLLGAFSYSIYLLHGPFVELAGAVVRRAGEGVTAGAIVFGALIPLVLALAYGFYLLFERPFLSPALRAAIDAETAASETLHPATIINVRDDQQPVAAAVEPAVAGAAV